MFDIRKFLFPKICFFYIFAFILFRWWFDLISLIIVNLTRFFFIESRNLFCFNGVNWGMNFRKQFSFQWTILDVYKLWVFFFFFNFGDFSTAPQPRQYLNYPKLLKINQLLFSCDVNLTRFFFHFLCFCFIFKSFGIASLFHEISLIFLLSTPGHTRNIWINFYQKHVNF